LAVGRGQPKAKSQQSQDTLAAAGSKGTGRCGGYEGGTGTGPRSSPSGIVPVPRFGVAPGYWLKEERSCQRPTAKSRQSPAWYAPYVLLLQSRCALPPHGEGRPPARRGDGLLDEAIRLPR